MIIIYKDDKKVGAVFNDGDILTGDTALKKEWSKLLNNGLAVFMPTLQKNKKLLVDAVETVRFSKNTEGSFAVELENLGYITSTE